MSQHPINLVINGRKHNATVEGRLTLSDFLRGDAGCTGVHVGCEHGVCGACTVIVDGNAVRSCLMLAVQADGCAVTTVEGLAADDGTLHPVQQALRDEHGLQCGFRSEERRVGKELSVRVDLGGRRTLKKKKKIKTQI